MKINRLEAHDRLEHLIEDQSANIFQGAEDCLKKNPLSLALQDKCPYIYMFAHPRTHDDGINKKLFWQPRLSIPEPQINSYLFRVNSNTDLIEVCWILPPKEMWDQYKKGNVTESNWALWSINQYVNDKKLLSKPHPEDWPEEKTKLILNKIIKDSAKSSKKTKPKSLEAFLNSPK